MRSLVWLLTVCIHSVYLEEISHQHEEHIVEVTALRPPLAPDKSTPHREAQHNGARPVTGAATLGNNGVFFDPLNMEKQILHLLAEDKGKCQNHPFQSEGVEWLELFKCFKSYQQIIREKPLFFSNCKQKLI